MAINTVYLIGQQWKALAESFSRNGDTASAAAADRTAEMHYDLADIDAGKIPGTNAATSSATGAASYGGQGQTRPASQSNGGYVPGATETPYGGAPGSTTQRPASPEPAGNQSGKYGDDKAASGGNDGGQGQNGPATRFENHIRPPIQNAGAVGPARGPDSPSPPAGKPAPDEASASPSPSGDKEEPDPKDANRKHLENVETVALIDGANGDATKKEHRKVYVDEIHRRAKQDYGGFQDREAELIKKLEDGQKLSSSERMELVNLVPKTGNSTASPVYEYWQGRSKQQLLDVVGKDRQRLDMTGGVPDAGQKDALRAVLRTRLADADGKLSPDKEAIIKNYVDKLSGTEMKDVSDESEKIAKWIKEAKDW